MPGIDPGTGADKKQAKTERRKIPAYNDLCSGAGGRGRGGDLGCILKYHLVMSMQRRNP